MRTHTLMQLLTTLVQWSAVTIALYVGMMTVLAGSNAQSLIA